MAIAAIRYNNPGNVSLPIRGWTGGGTIVGIKGQSGYAKFSSMKEGAAALQQRLSTRIQDGYTTIAKLNPIYAEDTNWKYGVSKLSGIGINDPLDMNNASQMKALTNGIVQQETGMTPSQLGLDGLGNYNPVLVPGGSVEAFNQDTMALTSNIEGGYTLDSSGNYTWTGDPESNPETIAAAQQEAAAKSAEEIKAGDKGSATSVPVAIVTAGNQQAQTMAAAIKGLASSAASTAQAQVKAEEVSDSTWKGWLGNRLLQIAVFLVALVFILIGLYAFARNQNMVPTIA